MNNKGGGRVWYNPANPSQTYSTIIPNDPNVPAGYVDSQGSDGAIPEALKVYTAGVNNQGAGAVGYLATADGDPGMRAVAPHHPNGILGPVDYVTSLVTLGYGYGAPPYGTGPYGAGGLIVATPVL